MSSFTPGKAGEETVSRLLVQLRLTPSPPSAAIGAQSVEKLQVPNPKLQKNPNFQISNSQHEASNPFGSLEFGIFLGFGIWGLGFLTRHFPPPTSAGF